MKKYSVVLLPDALDDLAAIYNHIADKSQMPEVALTYIEKLEESCYKLELAPMRGQQRDDLRTGLRIVPIDKNAVAAFEVNETSQTVEILNIFYHGQDYEAVMSDMD